MREHVVFLSHGCLSALMIGSLLYSGLATPLHAEQPSTAPLLRIEIAMHTAPISQVAVDAANRFLVTGSHDKTIRVWELATGRLLQTLRPPIGEGFEGKIYAVALSPDGQTVACGGWTGRAWEPAHSVYLFDRASGQMLRRLTVPHVIYHLAYSLDGRFLVATLWGETGIRIYRTTDYALVQEDGEYGGDSFGATFDRSGRLVTASYDGLIRLYDQNFQLIVKRPASGGRRPHSVSFSPDGAKVAVGFQDSPNVNVLSGIDLSPLYSPDTGGIERGNLSAVAWSADGQFLYAGGEYAVQSTHPIRKWADEGRGHHTDLPAANDTIMHIVSLSTGGIMFGAQDPAFGIFDAQDHRSMYKRPAIVDHRGRLQHFLVARDGTMIQFDNEQPSCFSLTEHTLTSQACHRSPGSIRDLQRRLADKGFHPGPADGVAESHTESAIRDFQLQAGLAVDGEISVPLLQALGIPPLTPPLTTAAGLNITDWSDTYTPKLNGRSLPLEQYEKSRSLAIAPDEQSFLLGTESRLRLFDRQGNEKWQIPSPGVVWGVNISGNSQLAVAALGDGTLRWYRLASGEELLAFFPHRDGKRWVLWTPESFFAASADGERLIGYHRNRHLDQAAEFVDVKQLYNLFYRPDLVSKRLEGRYGEETLAQLRKSDIQTVLAKGLPPVVELLSPPDVTHDRTEFPLELQLTDQGGGIGDIVVRNNGVVVMKTRAVDIPTPGRPRFSLPIPLHPGSNEIVASVYTRDNEIESRAATKTVEVRESPTVAPSLYVLAVGINDYRDPDFQLRYAESDARAMVQELSRRGSALFKSIHMLPLLNDKATRAGIEKAFEEIVRVMQPSDVFVLYLAGHGMALDGEYYFIPQDAVFHNEDSIRTQAWARSRSCSS